MLHEKLKELRESHNLTKRELCEKTGISERAYLTYEFGEREPKVSVIEKLADFYGVTTDYLLGREQTDEQPKPTQAEQEQELLETYFRLEPQKRAVFLETLLEIVRNGGIPKPAPTQTVTVRKAARPAPGGEHEPIHEEQMSLEDAKKMLAELESLPDADDDL